ncbi:hypothetical protein [Kitasatospora sp. MAP5-34]|uniref:hypothetical protein n=1 Tax=Kitasatospora sp. MAP5-34 TaxID=3035102 RepID=UPI002475404F|nr:hypothetical protein [Kitasatospora sp. MAP5-34]MDH6578240.1 hypothetical protein [Kitasatospora sp. MAP5-34]
MSGDQRDGDMGVESALVDWWLTDPGFLVTADPGRVVALLDAMSGPGAWLGAAVHQVSASASDIQRQWLAR